MKKAYLVYIDADLYVFSKPEYAARAAAEHVYRHITNEKTDSGLDFAVQEVELDPSPETVAFP